MHGWAVKADEIELASQMSYDFHHVSKSDRKIGHHHSWGEEKCRSYHLRAARTVVSETSVGVVARGNPTLDVGLTINELEVTRALAITVSCSVCRTSLVGAREATIGGHRDKIQGAVQATRKLRHIHVEGEFVAQEVEDLVLCRRRHQVRAGADILAVAVFRDKVQSQSVTAGGDTVGGLVVGAVEAAVLSACFVSGADRGVP